MIASLNLQNHSFGGCGPVVRLLGCHARAQRSVPHIREWHLMWRRLVDINYTCRRVLQTWQCGPTATLTQW